MRFRCLQEHVHRDFGHGKYMSLKDEPARVFNIGAIHRADDELHIAEGEFDSMILNKVGMPAIAIPGAQGWSSHHRRMVAGFSKVYVWGDPDEAGSEFIGKVTRAVRNAVGVRLLKADGDVTELYLKGGVAALRARKRGE
ncbi:toprim domain-containing protein [Cellulomonas sp. SG140]|uniref:toprim domain-containing protein n=1 Tax=Cellulomonas sp. SG140 TaxID=2976536 RepID=UPI0021E975BF|nr:toprim domain-containing protein [Cellulomonas sp. SG140]